MQALPDQTMDATGRLYSERQACQAIRSVFFSAIQQPKSVAIAGDAARRDEVR